MKRVKSIITRKSSKKKYCPSLIQILIFILFRRLSIFVILLILITGSIMYFKSDQINNITTSTTNITNRYSYYVCTQVMNEPEMYLTEWIEYQLHVIGFRNICLINVGQPFDKTFLSRYSISIINKKEKQQEFNKYCLSCFDPPMKPHDLLMIQDIDEYLNVRQADIISKNYDKYDRFHFREVRYGREK
jgi:hypothetical protein